MYSVACTVSGQRGQRVVRRRVSEDEGGNRPLTFRPLSIFLLTRFEMRIYKTYLKKYDTQSHLAMCHQSDIMRSRSGVCVCVYVCVCVCERYCSHFLHQSVWSWECSNWNSVCMLHRCVLFKADSNYACVSVSVVDITFTLFLPFSFIFLRCT